MWTDLILIQLSKLPSKGLLFLIFNVKPTFLLILYDQVRPEVITAVARMVTVFHDVIPSSVKIRENLPDCNMSHPRKQ